MSRSLVSIVKGAFTFTKTCQLQNSMLNQIHNTCRAYFSSNLQNQTSRTFLKLRTYSHSSVSNLSKGVWNEGGKIWERINLHQRTSNVPLCQCSTSGLQQNIAGARSFHRDTKFLAKTQTAPVENKPPQALNKKKKKKKKTAQLKAEVTEKTVVAYATADEYDLDKLRMALTEQGLYNFTELHQDMEDVLHVTPKYEVAEREKEIFFFENGTVIFWDVPYTEMVEVIKFLRLNGNGTYERDLSDSEAESLEYKIDDCSKASFSKDILTLSSSNDPELMLSEKFTCSNILSHSVKLAIWECEVDKFIDQMEDLTKDLKRGKGLKIKRREVLRQIGQAYEYRQKIHSSDLQDTPDFYWDREQLEVLYNRLHGVFTIKKRTEMLMVKLNYCCDFLDLIDSKLSDQMHVRLEWYIIALILLEVGFETLHEIRLARGRRRPDDDTPENPIASV